jgi:hypothetical protein
MALCAQEQRTASGAIAGSDQGRLHYLVGPECGYVVVVKECARMVLFVLIARAALQVIDFAGL